MNNFLVFTDSYTGLLVRMDLNTYSFTGLQMAGAYNPVALAYNPLDRRLYFSQVMSNPGSQIFSIGLDAGQPTLLKQMPQGAVVFSCRVLSCMHEHHRHSACVYSHTM